VDHVREGQPQPLCDLMGSHDVLESNNFLHGLILPYSLTTTLIACKVITNLIKSSGDRRSHEHPYPTDQEGPPL
jgi:hypothetical protein